jgi:acylphosphatase
VTTFHAVVWIDHAQAQVLQFDTEHVQAQKVKASTQHTRQHGSSARTEHEFFGHVCDALEGIVEVLAVGPKTGLADFRHFVEKHRGETARRIVGYEIEERSTENQLVALARRYFLKYDRVTGTPTPS